MCQTPLAESRLCHSRYLAREVIQQALTAEHLPSVKQVGRLSLGCVPMKASTQTPFEEFLQTKRQTALFELYVATIADMRTIESYGNHEK